MSIEDILGDRIQKVHESTGKFPKELHLTREEYEQAKQIARAHVFDTFSKPKPKPPMRRKLEKEGLSVRGNWEVIEVVKEYDTMDHNYLQELRAWETEKANWERQVKEGKKEPQCVSFCGVNLIPIK